MSVGFDLDQARASLLDRVRLLAQRSATVDDAERMAAVAAQIFQHFEDGPGDAFSAIEKQTVVLGCLFSDIGKTGPEHGSAEDQQLIAEMFAVEGVPNDTISVEEFIRTYFPNDAGPRLGRFRALGLDPSITIRAFWNLHTGWTLSILEKAGVPREAVAAAATHHLLDNVNPESIVGEDGRFSRDFGENATFDRAEKLIILLDKYDAVRRRGGRSHGQAIEWLRERIAKSPRSKGDPEVAALLDVVDTVLGNVEPKPGS